MGNDMSYAGDLAANCNFYNLIKRNKQKQN